MSTSRLSHRGSDSTSPSSAASLENITSVCACTYACSLNSENKRPILGGWAGVFQNVTHEQTTTINFEESDALHWCFQNDLWAAVPSPDAPASPAPNSASFALLYNRTTNMWFVHRTFFFLSIVFLYFHSKWNLSAVKWCKLQHSTNSCFVLTSPQSKHKRSSTRSSPQVAPVSVHPRFPSNPSHPQRGWVFLRVTSSWTWFQISRSHNYRTYPAIYELSGSNCRQRQKITTNFTTVASTWPLQHQQIAVHLIFGTTVASFDFIFGDSFTGSGIAAVMTTSGVRLPSSIPSPMLSLLPDPTSFASSASSTSAAAVSDRWLFRDDCLKRQDKQSFVFTSLEHASFIHQLHKQFEHDVVIMLTFGPQNIKRNAYEYVFREEQKNQTSSIFVCWVLGCLLVMWADLEHSHWQV